METNSEDLFAVNDATIMWGKCTIQNVRTLLLAQHLPDNRTWTTAYPGNKMRAPNRAQSRDWVIHDPRNTQSTKLITPEQDMYNHL